MLDEHRGRRNIFSDKKIFSSKRHACAPAPTYDMVPKAYTVVK